MSSESKAVPLAVVIEVKATNVDEYKKALHDSFLPVVSQSASDGEHTMVMVEADGNKVKILIIWSDENDHEAMKTKPEWASVHEKLGEWTDKDAGHSMTTVRGSTFFSHSPHGHHH